MSSAAAVAKQLGVSERAVRKAAAIGRIQRLPDGSWPPDAAEQMNRNGNPRKMAAKRGGDRADLTEETVRLTRAKADMAELELAQRRGELVEVDRVGAHLETCFAAVRAKLLALPTRAAPLIAPERLSEVAALLDDMVREALEGLTVELGAVGEDTAGGADAEAAAEAAAERVGGSVSDAEPGGQRRARQVADDEGAASARADGRDHGPKRRGRRSKASVAGR